jgi:hypothetical protein
MATHVAIHVVIHVVIQAQGSSERNYHAFYHLLVGCRDGALMGRYVIGTTIGAPLV